MRPEGSLPHSQGDIFYIGEKIFPPAQHKYSELVHHHCIKWFWLTTYLHRYVLWNTCLNIMIIYITID